MRDAIIFRGAPKIVKHFFEIRDGGFGVRLLKTFGFIGADIHFPFGLLMSLDFFLMGVVLIAGGVFQLRPPFDSTWIS